MTQSQLDLFRAKQEPELSDDNWKPVIYYPNPDKVCVKLHRILAEARSAKTYPWDDYHVGLYQLIFPQMSGCLPQDEAAQLKFEFETEMARLAAAA